MLFVGILSVPFGFNDPSRYFGRCPYMKMRVC